MALGFALCINALQILACTLSVLRTKNRNRLWWHPLRSILCRHHICDSFERHFLQVSAFDNTYRLTLYHSKGGPHNLPRLKLMHRHLNDRGKPSSPRIVQNMGEDEESGRKALSNLHNHFRGMYWSPRVCGLVSQSLRKRRSIVHWKCRWAIVMKIFRYFSTGMVVIQTRFGLSLNWLANTSATIAKEWSNLVSSAPIASAAVSQAVRYSRRSSPWCPLWCYANQIATR